KPPHVIVVVLDGRLTGALHQETLVRLQEHSPKSAFVLIAPPDDYLAQVAATRLDALLLRAPVNIDDLRILIMRLPGCVEAARTIRTMYQAPFRARLESKPD